jgi:hypothetical protein
MKLITKEIEKRLEKYPLYSQDGKGDDATIVCKFFSPVGWWTWYVLEADKMDDGDYEMYALVVNGHGETEYGYFLLSELQNIRLPFGLGIERDIYFTPSKVKDVIKS